MRCPSLSELPPPPPGKTGWPWTEESPQITSNTFNNKPLPKISIVTPSYNQGQFIEETIRSILLQGYPDLEYIIMDGGSKDNSVEIIRKYEPWLSYWVSERDRGQSHAVNKGFERATGDIIAWVNSDDTLENNCLAAIGNFLVKNPDVDVIYGNAKIIDAKGEKIAELRTIPFTPQAFLYNTVHIAAQSSVFWRRELFFKVGMLNEKLRYTMDFELWVKFLESGAKFGFIRSFLGTYRCHGESKTFGIESGSEAESLTIETVAKVRQRSDYKYWRFLYRIRQLAMLIIQGDIDYIWSRIAARLQGQRDYNQVTK